MKEQSMPSKVRTGLSWTYRLVKSQEIHEVIFHLLPFLRAVRVVKGLSQGAFLVK